MHKTKSVRLMSDDLNNPERIERKQIETILDGCSKLIQQCNKKELKVADLKWQPHYSTVLKQLKSQLESIMSTDSSKSLNKLNSIPYLIALKNNIFSLLNYFSKFVIDNISSIGNKDHHTRKTFFVKVVHFQFLCYEIEAYFPDGIYSPSKVKISKPPAKIWWLNKFGEKIFVDLETFISKFKEDYPFINQAEIFSFKNSINFTSTNFITTFEFDLFTRLYAPWEMIQEAWRIIYNHPGYLHFSTYGDTKDILSRHLDRPGTYVFRVSCKDLGYWTIGYVKGCKDMGQIKVDKTNLIETLVEGQKKNIYVYPNGEYTNPDLSNLNQYRKQIIVKNEDLQLYDCFEDFKECKICRESEKDLQLESCGHQICQGCYKMLRKYDKKLCPFCNQKILSTSKIVNITNPYIDFNPSSIKSKNELDSVYIDMSLDMKNSFDGDESVNIRVNSVSRSTSDSIYSNTLEDSISFELPTRAPPEAPPRPVKDKVFQLKSESSKPTINYPPMLGIKDVDVALDQQRKTVTARKEVRPRSSIYTEMISNEVDNQSITTTLKDSYSDIADHAAFDRRGNKISFTNDSSFSDDIYCNPNEISTTNHVLGNCTIKNIMYPQGDDIYCNPIETKNADIFFDNNSERFAIEFDRDDMYYNPIETNHENTIMDNFNGKLIAELKRDDIYCNANETNHINNVFGYHNKKIELYSERDDVYSNPIETSRTNNVLKNHNQKIELYSERDDVYSNPNETNHTNNVLDNRNEKVSQYSKRDDIYCNPIESNLTNIFLDNCNKRCAIKFEQDDIYYNPIETNHENTIMDNSKSICITELAPNDTFGHHSDINLEKIGNSVTELNRDVIHYNPSEVHENEDILIGTKIENIVPDEIYCNLSEEIEDKSNIGAQEDDLLSRWSEVDVGRALRIARYDRVLARDILLEFVDAN